MARGWLIAIIVPLFVAVYCVYLERLLNGVKQGIEDRIGEVKDGVESLVLEVNHLSAMVAKIEGRLDKEIKH
jgi:hypothetical protein